MNNISILQWNVAGSRITQAYALAQALRQNYDIVALQEVYRDSAKGAIYCPSMCGYTPIYHGSGGAALFVHKDIDKAAWEQRSGFNWAAVVIHNFTFWSIYVEPDSSGARRSPLSAITKLRPSGEHALFGDFNAHHPLWDRHGRTSRYASELLNLVIAWELELATPPRLVTRRGVVLNGERDSTIDLAWSSMWVGINSTY